MNSPTLPCQLRSDVRIMRTGPHDFRLVDNSSSVNFKLDGGDRYLLALLGECSSIDDVINAYETKFRTPLTTENLQEFIGQLSDLGLLMSGGYAPTVEQTTQQSQSLR